MNHATIAAIATGLTESGIGIIRISGPESYEIIQKIFRKKNGQPPKLEESHRVQYGYILKTQEGETDSLKENVSRETSEIITGMYPSEDKSEHTSGKASEEILDEVLVLNMKAPHSYTGEDTIEIDCHGGVLMMKQILNAVIRAGAELAQPGEFTKRAFLNGRLDLSQAEAVIDIINAKNDRALRASVSQLKGAASEKIKTCRETLLEDTAYIEAALDDPEHIELDGFTEKLTAHIESSLSVLQHLIDTAENGKLIREGIRTAIVGKPNAGKSSLLNVLVGEERAIVTEIAGTTRDTLEETINLRGVTLNVIDTAGIRETDDVVEQIGVQRALKTAEEADLVIYVVDASVPLDESDRQILRFIREQKKKAIVLLNKNDLEAVVTEAELQSEISGETAVLSVSAKLESGIHQLEQEIEALFYQGKISANDEVYLSTARQKEALIAARDALVQVQNSIDNNMPEDFLSIDLMNAYTQLGYILGEEVDEDLINEIFSKFCMGK